MFLLAVAIASIACVAGAPVTCNHESCNPAYEPFPNLHAAMVGYHIMRGNPFDQSTLYDPGFKTSFIFLPMIKNDQHKYELHPGVTATGRSACKLTISNEVITNVKQYQSKVTDKATQGMDFASNNEVELEVGAKGVSAKGKIPPIVTAKFSASKAFGENEKFFTKEKGVVTMSDAACPAYTLHLSRFDPPPFSPAFIKGLQFLETYVNKSSSEQDTAFNYFIHEFGTHFISFAVMGARIAVTSRYTSKEYHEQGQTNVEKCNSHKIGISVGFSVSESKAKCQATNGANSKYLNNGMHRYYVSSYGSKPKKDLVEWASQDFDEPVPIKMQLSPITNLFQDIHMNPKRLNGHNLDTKGILKFFGGRYWNYCKWQGAAMGVKSCEPENEKGCGWNDDCVRGVQGCINSNKYTKGYFCCNDPCKNKCGGHGKCEKNLDTCSYKCTCDKGYGGTNCQERHMVKEVLEPEIKEQMRVGQGRSNDDFRDDLREYLKKQYPLYRMQVTIMSPNSHYAFRGYDDGMALVEDAWGKCAIVSFAKLTEDTGPFAATSASALAMVKDHGCNMDSQLKKVWEYTKDKGVISVIVARHGSSLRQSSYGPGGYFQNYRCYRDCDIWGCNDHSASLILYF